MPVYFDTSALAKRYLPEPASDALDAFLAESGAACVISPLVATELESVLARLTRRGLVDTRFAARARREFAADLTAALWQMRAFDDASFLRAAALIRDGGQPLATLDALHLASALELGCDALATGDRQLARAAEACGLAVHPFL